MLLIEDDQEMAETIAGGLRRARMAVDLAFDGSDGLVRSLVSEQQLEELIDSLIALARGEQAVQRGEPVDLAEVTRALLQARTHEIERQHLRGDAELDPAWTDGDRHLLERLVANLLDNAIAHNTPGGRLSVTTSTREGRVILSVVNTGPVIAPDELDRLQQPFQRLSAERTNRGEGHGLGLPIIAAITTSQGGALHLDARREGGLHAQVELLSRPALRQSASALDVRRVQDVEA